MTSWANVDVLLAGLFFGSILGLSSISGLSLKMALPGSVADSIKDYVKDMVLHSVFRKR